MADRRVKRVKATGPGYIALVLFLIMLFMSNIVLGLLLYFALDEKNIEMKKSADATKVKNGDKQMIELYQALLDEMRLAMGQEINADSQTKLDAIREAYLKDDASGYAKVDASNRAAVKELIETLRKDLDFKGGKYSTTYLKKAELSETRATTAEASWKKAQKDLKDLQDQWGTLVDKHKKFQAEVSARLDKEKQSGDDKFTDQEDRIKKEIQRNDELAQDFIAKINKFGENLKAKEKQYLKLKDEFDEFKKLQGDVNVARPSDTREPHALLLDISTNKPLWDDPVGTVTRVSAGGKEVTINLGSAKGVKPDLTFSVFAPSPYSAVRAEKRMKGTIEVTRVLGPNSSTARITANYDPDFTITEGDLLFNMFWGTRVAVAGYVDITGVPSDSPTEQMRQLSDFLYLLDRQGIIVDAYVDLTDGQVRGTISPSTRFLIRGSDLRLDPKELEEMQPRAQRAKAVNDKNGEVVKDAIGKGLFVISDKNFANVIGYRSPSASSKDQPRLLLPTAGSIAPGAGGGGGAKPPVEPPPPPPEKKDDKKDEKKDDKAGAARRILGPWAELASAWSDLQVRPVSTDERITVRAILGRFIARAA